MLALGTGLQEARKASEVATWNGETADARRSVALAIAHLEDALALLGPEQ